MLHIYAAFAEKERRLISERTKEGLRQARLRGKQIGGMNAQSLRTQAEAIKRAEALRPVLTELVDTGMSANAMANESQPTQDRGINGRRQVARTNRHPAASPDRQGSAASLRSDTGQARTSGLPMTGSLQRSEGGTTAPVCAVDLTSEPMRPSRVTPGHSCRRARSTLR
jgi:hypothetical protein